MDKRTPRSMEARDQDGRYTYVPPSALPSPPEEDGWGFRWVATAVQGAADPANTSKRFREGWEPCKAADYPQLGIAANGQGNIEVGGLILCKAPREMIDARTRYYGQQARAQTQSVDEHFLRDQNSKMPKFSEKTTEVTTGRGRFGDGTK